MCLLLSALFLPYLLQLFPQIGQRTRFILQSS
nr:MAG TPA: hypothetical protein [Caudoviricetes sp.]